MLAARTQSISDASSLITPFHDSHYGESRPACDTQLAPRTATRLFEPGYLHGQGVFPGCPTTEVEQPGGQT